MQVLSEIVKVCNIVRGQTLVRLTSFYLVLKRKCAYIYIYSFRNKLDG